MRSGQKIMAQYDNMTKRQTSLPKDSPEATDKARPSALISNVHGLRNSSNTKPPRIYGIYNHQEEPNIEVFRLTALISGTELK